MSRHTHRRKSTVPNRRADRVSFPTSTPEPRKSRTALPGLPRRLAKIVRQMANGATLHFHKYKLKVGTLNVKLDDFRTLMLRGLVQWLRDAGKWTLTQAGWTLVGGKHVVAVERHIAHEPPTLRREAGSVLSASLKARGAIA